MIFTESDSILGSELSCPFFLQSTGFWERETPSWRCESEYGCMVVANQSYPILDRGMLMVVVDPYTCHVEVKVILLINNIKQVRTQPNS